MADPKRQPADRLQSFSAIQGEPHVHLFIVSKPSEQNTDIGQAILLIEREFENYAKCSPYILKVDTFSNLSRAIHHHGNNRVDCNILIIISNDTSYLKTVASQTCELCRLDFHVVLASPKIDNEMTDIASRYIPVDLVSLEKLDHHLDFIILHAIENKPFYGAKSCSKITGTPEWSRSDVGTRQGSTTEEVLETLEKFSDVETNADLSILSWRVLLMLSKEEGPLCISDISIILKAPLSTVSRVVTKLVLTGFLEKRKDHFDARRLLVQCTDLATSKIKAITGDD